MTSIHLTSRILAAVAVLISSVVHLLWAAILEFHTILDERAVYYIQSRASKSSWQELRKRPGAWLDGFKNHVVLRITTMTRSGRW